MAVVPVLKFKVIEAHLNKAADAFVVVEMGSQKFQTKQIKKSAAPQWNESHDFDVDNKNDAKIVVKVKAEGTFTTDSLYSFEIAVKDLEDDDVQTRTEKFDKGDLTFEIAYHPDRDDIPPPLPSQSHTGAVRAAEEVPYSIEPIENYYELKEVLGSGSYAVVRLGINKRTHKQIAIKFIDKAKAFPLGAGALRREIEIMTKLKHPNIITLYEVFESGTHVMLCMEYVTGGELFDRIVERGHYSEKSAAKAAYQLVSAVKYLHDNGIAHRDLKPENLLLASRTTDDELKVADFGLSKIFSDQVLKTSCGTPGYVAPEVLLGRPYTKAVDMWSVGVITYILLCGFPPFDGEGRAIIDATLSAKYNFPDPWWTAVSDQAKDLIRHLLVKDPENRFTADQALAHPWFNTAATSNVMLSAVGENMRRSRKKLIDIINPFKK